MRQQGIKADLHVHSRYSSCPAQWFLKKMGSPESFTDPRTVYSLAKKQGMDLVTVSDHDTLAGALEIAHLEDVFLSEEITAVFPEDGCKLHVLALDIDEHTHEDLQRLRENVYDLAAYLHQKDILHTVAHPLCHTNHSLTLEHVEKMLLLFTHFEQSGARNPRQNEALLGIFQALTPELIDRLADKHGIKPLGKHPWIKKFTAGSDDHSGLNISRFVTLAHSAESREDFFREVRAGTAETQGIPASPRSLAHNLYGISYQFLKSRFHLDRFVHKDRLLRFADTALGVPENDDRSLWTRLLDSATRRTSALFTRGGDSLSTRLQREAHLVITRDPSLEEIRQIRASDPWQAEEKWFDFATQVTDRAIQASSRSILDQVFQIQLFNIFDSMSSTGSIYTLLSPYFVSYRLFTKDREFSEACLEHFCPSSRESARRRNRSSLALFTDTFLDRNGVARTLQSQLQMARKHSKEMTVLTCGEEAEEEGTKSFSPVGSFELPDSPGVHLQYPPLLQMLDYCDRCGFGGIHAATPGPMGMAALGIARILDLPLSGTYHPALPQHVAELTGDGGLEEMAWKFMVWFYNQMDCVYVPSRAAADKLEQKGIRRDKIVLYPNSIDTARFHPAKRNGFWKNRFSTEAETYKLLYVGRISREKNLHLLTEAFLRLSRERDDVRLVVVGDGPYLQQMRQALEGTRALFSGPLYGEELAQAYASSDLFLHPSSTHTPANVILEAQASGVPVVVGDCGGARENVVPGETGVIAPHNDPVDFARTIGQLLRNPQKLRDMGENARQRMEQRSAESSFLRTWEMHTHGFGPSPEKDRD